MLGGTVCCLAGQKCLASGLDHYSNREFSASLRLGLLCGYGDNLAIDSEGVPLGKQFRLHVPLFEHRTERLQQSWWHGLHAALGEASRR